MKQKLLMIVFLVVIGSLGFSFEFQIIKDPQPTHVEKGFKNLVKVETPLNQYHKKYFLTFPFSMTIDKDNYLYVYDQSQAKIFKFDQKFEFVNSFIAKPPKQQGSKPEKGVLFINIGKDNHLYACDYNGKILVAYDGSGKILRQYSIFNVQAATPQVDQQGKLYLPSINDGGVDIFDRHMHFQKSLLDLSKFHTFLFQKPPPLTFRRHVFPFYGNVMAAPISQDRLIIYVFNSSEIFVFKNHKLQFSTHIWPREALKLHRMKLALVTQKRPTAYRDLFMGFFIDQDNDNHFYLQFGQDIHKNTNVIYRFDLRGQLINTLHFKYEHSISNKFLIKKNGKFYAIDKKHNINIFKEV